MSHLIAPSLLSANFLTLEQEVQMLNNSEADWLHLDIMDGVFVPNISFGLPIVKAIKQKSEKPLDVHLMIVEPHKYIDAFAKVGANILTVHYEACTHLHRTIYAIKDAGMQAGVALNPHTPVRVLEDIATDLDLILIMSVNPGFGGQKFINNTYKKIKETRIILEMCNGTAFIEVDGGVDLFNATPLIEAGADVLVAGNSIFGSGNPTQTILRLKR